MLNGEVSGGMLTLEEFEAGSLEAFFRAASTASSIIPNSGYNGYGILWVLWISLG